MYNDFYIFLLTHHKVLLADAYDRKLCREETIQQNPANCQSLYFIYKIEKTKIKQKINGNTHRVGCVQFVMFV